MDRNNMLKFYLKKEKIMEIEEFLEKNCCSFCCYLKNYEVEQVEI